MGFLKYNSSFLVHLCTTHSEWKTDLASYYSINFILTNLQGVSLILNWIHSYLQILCLYLSQMNVGSIVFSHIIIHKYQRVNYISFIHFICFIEFISTLCSKRLHILLLWLLLVWWTYIVGQVYFLPNYFISSWSERITIEFKISDPKNIMKWRSVQKTYSWGHFWR